VKGQTQGEGKGVHIRRGGFVKLKECPKFPLVEWDEGRKMVWFRNTGRGSMKNILGRL